MVLILGIGLLILAAGSRSWQKPRQEHFEFKKGLSEGEREYEDARELRQVEEDLKNAARSPS